VTTITDYNDRTIDLSMFANVQEDGESLLVQQLAGEGDFGSICTGVQKVAQRFTIRLFTVRGSVLHQPTEGCDFMRDMMVGRFRSTVDVFASFAEAKTAILEQFRNEQLAYDPDEERLADAELLQVVLAMDFLGLRVRVVTAAGTSRSVIIPIPVIV
jgi:hypothetical protein